MSTVLIIANILSFIGNTLFTLSTLLKSKRKILLFQSSNHMISSISEYMMEAYTGIVQEAASLLRNTIFLFVKDDALKIKLIITIIITIMATIIGIIFNILFSDGVWYGYLPIIGSFIYSLGVILAFVLPVGPIKAEIILKIFLMVNAVAWGLYGIIVKLYPIFVFNSLNIDFVSISYVSPVVIEKPNGVRII